MRISCLLSMLVRNGVCGGRQGIRLVRSPPDVSIHLPHLSQAVTSMFGGSSDILSSRSSPTAWSTSRSRALPPDRRNLARSRLRDAHLHQEQRDAFPMYVALP